MALWKEGSWDRCGWNLGPLLGLSLDQPLGPKVKCRVITAGSGGVKSAKGVCKALRRGTIQILSFLPDSALLFNLIPSCPLHPSLSLLLISALLFESEKAFSSHHQTPIWGGLLSLPSLPQPTPSLCHLQCCKTCFWDWKGTFAEPSAKD